MPPFLILLIGMAVVVGAILLLRLHAFLALIVAAVLVSLLAPGTPATTITRIADAFGRTAGSVGIIIALAAIVGTAMTESGAADRIINAFLRVLGEQHDAVALSATAFLLSLPVFFDTIFFLLAPLARSMYRRTQRDYLKYLLAMSASGVATHTLVPPHPGPLGVAATLGIDLGMMILVGVLVSLPSAVVGFQFARWANARMPVPMREYAAEQATTDARALHAPAATLPSLGAALLPVLLPVTLISTNTVVEALRTAYPARAAFWNAVQPVTATLGNANLALLLSAAIASWIYIRQRKPTGTALTSMVETSLMGAGIVILIVAAGGAFGAMLQAAQVGPAIQQAFGATAQTSGRALLLLAFGVCVLLKVVQGSSTVAMIATAGMLGSAFTAHTLPYHPVYVATAISAGSLVGSWMNDAGFWVFSKVGNVTEMETLRSWSPLLAIVGITSLCTTLLLSSVLPLR
jgi:GntP family gluconate:H+ symporter